ncbi:hypothetical protein GCM10009675_14700 [Prauserella alba]|uniref:Uncharacterized protein n=1 Tax=Prauserella alba TaxID=176898 RepID=A0ABP4FTS6_9PSEU
MREFHSRRFMPRGATHPQSRRGVQRSGTAAEWDDTGSGGCARSSAPAFTGRQVW